MTTEQTTPTLADVDRMSFAELMELARQHRVPGRGNARLEQLRTGVRAALSGQAGTTVIAPHVPGRAAAMPVWRVAEVVKGERTTYVTTDGRWRIVGERYQVINLGRGGKSDAGREFTAYDNISGAQVGHKHWRLADAKSQVRQHVEWLAKAETDARLCERARLAGDPDWASATHGQVLEALAEDARREGERKRASGGGGPRELSGFGRLALAYRSAM